MWMLVLTYCGGSWVRMANVSTKGASDDEPFLSSRTDPKAKAQRNKRLGKTVVLTACGVGLHQCDHP